MPLVVDNKRNQAELQQDPPTLQFRQVVFFRRKKAAIAATLRIGFSSCPASTLSIGEP
jgi:hypothetical protein